MSGASDPVGPTARITAAWRAHEHERVVEPGGQGKLFCDPLASLLAGPAAMKKLENLAAAPAALLKFIRTMNVRTRFFDDAITLNIPPSSQVVLLGAGLDTRAYRVEALTKSVTYFEVDKSGMNDYKNTLLQDKEAKCMRVSIDADLCGTNWVEKLLGAGFKKEVPTIYRPTRRTF